MGAIGLMPRTLVFALFLIVFGIGGYLRFHGLTIRWDHSQKDKTSLLYRQFHMDEAVQGRKLGKLLDDGEYVYNPEDLHGPGLIYSTLPLAWIRGERTGASLTDFTLRAIPAAYGVALLLLLWAWREELGNAALLGGGILFAVSPIMVYFSRYYIMEVPMVFWITVSMIAAWRYVKRPGYGWAILFGVAGGLTHMTKETGAISFFTMAVAGAVVLLSHRHYLRTEGQHWKHLGASVGLGLLVSMIGFSVFFREPEAIWESIRTYFLYFERAEGSGHEKPWTHYLKILAWNRQPEGGPYWTEALTLFFGAIGLVIAFTPAVKSLGDTIFWRWIGLYTILTAAIYAAIPYKTPWSMLCWVFTLMLMAGLGLAFLISLRRFYHVVPVIALLTFGWGLVDLSKQTKYSVTTFRADYRNPFVYAHSPAKLIDLVRNVHDMAAVHPQKKKLTIALCDKDVGWPLPWYFRAFPSLGLAKSLPSDFDVLRAQDVVIISPDYDAAMMEATSETHAYETMYGIRDDLKVYNYVEKELYERFLDSRG